MALNLGELVATLAADNKPFNRGIDGAEARFDDFFIDAQGKLRHISGRFASEGERAGLGLGDGIDEGSRPGLDRAEQRVSRLSGAMQTFSKVGAAAGWAALGGGALQFAAALLPAIGALGAVPAAAGAAYIAMTALSWSLDGVGSALGASLTGDTQKFNKALQELPPSARAVVSELGGALEGLQKHTQSAFFGPMRSAAAGLAGDLRGPLRAGFSDVADSLGGIGADVLNFVRSAQTVSVISGLFAGVGAAIDGARTGVAPLLQGVRDLIGVFVPGLGSAGQSIGDTMARWGAWMSEIAASGQALEWFNSAKEALSSLWGIGKNVASILGGIFSAGDGAGLLSTIEQITGRMADWVNSMQGQEQLSEVFSLLGQVARDLMAILPGVATIIGGIASVMTSLPGPVKDVVTGLLAFAAAWRLLGLTSLINGARMAAAWLMAMGPVGWIITAVVALVALLILYWDEICLALETAWLWVRDTAISIWQSIVDFFVGIGEAIWSAATTCWNSIVSFLQWIFPYLLAVATGGLSLLVEWVVTHWDEILAWTSSIWQSIVDFFVMCWQGIVSAVETGVQGVLDFFGWLAALPGKALKWFGGILTSAINKGKELLGWARGLPGRVLSSLGNVASKLVGAGRDLIRGLLNGLKSAASSIWNWLKGMLSGLKDQVLEFFGVASPSKWFTWVGEMLGLGLANGIKASTGIVAKASDALNGAVSVPSADVAITASQRASGSAAAATMRLADEDRRLLQGAATGNQTNNVNLYPADNRFSWSDIKGQIAMQVS